MTRIPTLVLLLSALALGRADAAWPEGQPMLPVWKPASGDNPLSTHDFSSDPDAPFARGVVPLAARAAAPRLNVNPNARHGEGRVMVLGTSGFSASDTAAQSYGFAGAYGFSFWQYIDSYVYWGGSAGEGNILTPHPGVIDAGHRNGVRVYGTIFFPPNEFGGEMSRVEAMLRQTDDGRFPIADKLIELARTNGFDGFFINQETVGGDAETAGRMRDFMQYFQRTAGPEKELIWYDAMTESGAVGWQEQLNEQNDAFFHSGAGVVSEKMFLDFGWRKSDLRVSGANARALGRSPYDLYAAVNVEGAGYDQRVNWPALFPEGKPHAASLALFVPTWTWNRSTGDTPAARVADYRRRESLLWTGAAGDPSNTSEAIGRGNWRGVAHFVPARTPVVGDRFATSFNLGHGFGYYIDGERVSSAEWSNLSVQDLLPTWRWIVRTESERPLTAGLDFADAYHGGASLRLRGWLDAPTEVPLYASQLTVHKDTRLTIIDKAGGSDAGAAIDLEVALAFGDNPNDLNIVLPARGAATGGWRSTEFDLGRQAGKTISQIALRLSADQAVACDLRVGRLAIGRGDATPPKPPSHPRLLASHPSGPGEAALRIAWAAPTDPVFCYHIFQRHEGGERTFLDATTNTVAFVRGVRLPAGEGVTQLEVRAVSPGFIASPPCLFECRPRLP